MMIPLCPLQMDGGHETSSELNELNINRDKLEVTVE